MEPFVGMISILPYYNLRVPIGWMPCDGRLLSISEYEVLYTLLGTTYGGNGVSTFGIPDLRGRVPVGQGTATTGTVYTLGQMSGNYQTTLTTAQMPLHTHAVTPPATTGSVSVSDQQGLYNNAGTNQNTFGAVYDPANGINALAYNSLTPNIALNVGTLAHPPQVSVSGGSQPVTIMNPSLPLSYCIAVLGIFPPKS